MTVHPKLIHFPGQVEEQPPISTFEIILVVGLLCIEGAIGSVAIALDKFCGAVNDPKTVSTRTFKIPAELGDWKDPLNGRGILQQLYWGFTNCPTDSGSG